MLVAVPFAVNVWLQVEFTRVGTLINVTPEDRLLGSGRPVQSLRQPTARAAMIYMRASPARRPGAISR